MQTTKTTTTPLSALQMVGIILIANTAVRAIASRASTTVVEGVVEAVAETAAE